MPITCAQFTSTEIDYKIIFVTAVTSQERLLFEKNFFNLKKCDFYSREVTKREVINGASTVFIILST